MGFFDFLKVKELAQIAALQAQVVELQKQSCLPEIYHHLAVSAVAFSKLEESFETISEAQAKILVEMSEALARVGSTPAPSQPTGPAGACSFAFETVLIRFGLDAKMKKMGEVETAVPYIVEGFPVKFKKLFTEEQVTALALHLYLVAKILRESYEQPKAEGSESSTSEGSEPSTSETV